MGTKASERAGDLFSGEFVQEQLQKIFLCPAFSVSEILRRFLTYIVQETLAGRSNTIKEYTIAVNVLNKPASFRPQQDAIVRIHAGRLRRALNYYYKEQGSRDEIEISVPKGSYVPLFTTLIKGEERKEIILPVPSSLSLNDTVTLVVMPFKTLETDIARLSFVDCLGQQLAAEFGRFADFSVVSYYATQQSTEKNRDISEIAIHYGAQYLVSGNVQFESRKMRVSVQLTDTHSGTQVWSELYHRNYSASNLFDIADNIIPLVIGNLADFNGIIAQQMARGMTRNRKGKPCSTPISFYHEFYNNFQESTFKKVFYSMEQAVQQDPSSDLAWALLGELSLLAFLFSHDTKENPMVQGLRYAHMALNLNPLSQQAHITLGLAHLLFDRKKAACESLERALALSPNAAGMTGVIGCLMFAAGETERGIFLINRSIERNKSYPSIFNLFISLHHFIHQEFELAYQSAEKTGIPDLGLNILLRVSILSRMGRKTEASALRKRLRKRLITKVGFPKNL